MFLVEIGNLNLKFPELDNWEFEALGGNAKRIVQRLLRARRIDDITGAECFANAISNSAACMTISTVSSAEILAKCNSLETDKIPNMG